MDTDTLLLVGGLAALAYVLSSSSAGAPPAPPAPPANPPASKATKAPHVQDRTGGGPPATGPPIHNTPKGSHKLTEGDTDLCKTGIPNMLANYFQTKGVMFSTRYDELTDANQPNALTDDLIIKILGSGVSFSWNVDPTTGAHVGATPGDIYSVCKGYKIDFDGNGVYYRG